MSQAAARQIIAARRIEPLPEITVEGLDPAPFAPLFALGDEELAKRGIRRVIVSENPGISYPCRVSLDYPEAGEELLLLNFRHLDVPGSPYRAEGPVFVRRNARRYARSGIYPPIAMQRMMSLRAYDAEGMMLEAEVEEKDGLKVQIAEWFARPEIVHVDIHSMRRGCFFCRIERG